MSIGKFREFYKCLIKPLTTRDLIYSQDPFEISKKKTIHLILKIIENTWIYKGFEKYISSEYESIFKNVFKELEEIRDSPKDFKIEKFYSIETVFIVNLTRYYPELLYEKFHKYFQYVFVKNFDDILISIFLGYYRLFDQDNIFELFLIIHKGPEKVFQSLILAIEVLIKSQILNCDNFEKIVEEFRKIRIFINFLKENNFKPIINSLKKLLEYILNKDKEIDPKIFS